MFKKNPVIESARQAAPAGVLARSRSRRKRFLLVGTAALAAIGVAMGVSFLDSSGTASLAISGTSSTLVYPLSYVNDSSTTALPTTNPLTTTAFSGQSTLTGCGTGALNSDSSTSGYTTCTSPTNTINNNAIKNPSWSPVAGSAGTVTTAGDLALVDATSASNYVTVNMYLTNLSALAIDYSSFAFPINVYKTTCDADGNCSAWTEALTTPYYTYMTDTSGALTFNLAAGANTYYDIVMEGTNHTASAPANAPTGSPIPVSIGGSFYTTQTSLNPGSLSPSFYFTATSS
ncbi:MAG TPA: hypothetical protein VJ986_14660 [Gaiellaceae bacterium]|nr:hypothetical protein [Gaiellaceae bacterium]